MGNDGGMTRTPLAIRPMCTLKIDSTSSFLVRSIEQKMHMCDPYTDNKVVTMSEDVRNRIAFSCTWCAGGCETNTDMSYITLLNISHQHMPKCTYCVKYDSQSCPSRDTHPERTCILR